MRGAGWRAGPRAVPYAACSGGSSVLALSIIALFLGPLLYQWLRRGGRLARTVDALVVAALALLVIVLLVPESFVALGPVALVLPLS